MSILISAATDIELQAFAAAGGNTTQTIQLITGIGPLETALSMSCMLHRNAQKIDKVLNFGIAGAYPESNAGLLDICLAEQEVFGDLGICLHNRIERFAKIGLPVKDSFLPDTRLLAAAGLALVAAGIAYQQGIFVTVSCASGTQKRAQMLGGQFHGLCENMEGAAAVRACEQFALPCLEVRCISNIAGERNKKKWSLQQACNLAGRAVAAIVDSILSQSQVK